MSSKNFPGPNINRLIDQDPQIVKVPLDYTGWGARPSVMALMNSDPSSTSNNPGKPSAPEMTIRHVGSEK